MRIIKPLSDTFTVTDAMLTSSSIPEPDTGENPWNGATAYTAGDEVYLASNHTIYERLISGTTATSPDADTTNWVAVRKTNRWSMFDLFRNRKSVYASSLTVVITPGQKIDALAIAGLDNVNEIEITVTSDGEEIYSLTKNMNRRFTTGWYSYFFGEFKPKKSLAVFDIPPVPNPLITVTFTAVNGNVSVGSFLINMNKYIGNLGEEAISDVLNFSSVTRDEFGNSEMVARRNVPKLSGKILAKKGDINMIRVLRDELNATPAAYIGIDDSDDEYFEPNFIIGFYRQFSIDQRNPEHVFIDFEAEEI